MAAEEFLGLPPAAIAGILGSLLGAIVGGVTSGAVTYLMERRREKAASLSAARVLASHFATTGSALGAYVDDFPDFDEEKKRTEWAGVRDIASAAANTYDSSVTSLGGLNSQIGPRSRSEDMYAGSLRLSPSTRRAILTWLGAAEPSTNCRAIMSRCSTAPS